VSAALPNDSSLLNNSKTASDKQQTPQKPPAGAKPPLPTNSKPAGSLPGTGAQNAFSSDQTKQEDALVNLDAFLADLEEAIKRINEVSQADLKNVKQVLEDIKAWIVVKGSSLKLQFRKEDKKEKHKVSPSKLGEILTKILSMVSSPLLAEGLDFSIIVKSVVKAIHHARAKEFNYAQFAKFFYDYANLRELKTGRGQIDVQ
jgi:hypothetical protein